MQKYVILFLSVLVIALILGAWYKNNQYQKQLTEYSNKLAETQQLVKVGQNAYASQAIELDNLKAQNKDLQKAIKKNKEDIFALTNIALSWKDKYYEIKDAKQQVVDSFGSQPTSLSAECQSELADKRYRVDFKEEKDNLEVSGYTLTNPAYASINLHWTKPLQLELALTKTKDGTFKVYVADNANSLVPTELSLKVDKTILGRRWIEKINIIASLGVGHTVSDPKSWGGLITAGVGYLVTPRINVGLGVTALYNRDFQLYYQVYVNYFPFAASR